MEKRRVVCREIEEIEAVVCDVCGREFSDDGNECFEYHEMTRIGGAGGYGSVIGDGVEWSLDICQHCLVDKLGQWIRRQDQL